MYPKPILFVDDDEDDCLLLRKAFEASGIKNRLVILGDAMELMDYLLRRGRYKEEQEAPEPGLILLDLNMPRMDGHQALKEIKSHPRFRSIPVVVLTTAQDMESRNRSLDLGATIFLNKPDTFAELLKNIGGLGHFWF